MPLAPVNGIDLYYEVHGDGDDTIVFAHGGTGNHLSWFQQVPHFQDRYRCVVFDHRGFGQSVDIDDGPGAAAYPEDLRGLMDHLGIERAFLIGQSMGGRSVMGFTVAYPERVRALVLAGSTGTIEDPELRRMREEIRAGQVAALPVDAMYSSEFMEREPELLFLFQSIRNLNRPREETLETGSRPMDEQYLATPEWLAALEVPVMFVAGNEDILATPAVVDYVASLASGAVRREIAGAGHCAVLEDARTWNGMVDEFLESVRDR